jgi:TolC family type I secretion outer membrane protein
LNHKSNLPFKKDMMRQPFFTIVFSLFVWAIPLANPVEAMELQDALIQAYQSNPDIRAAEKSVEAVTEDESLALGRILPSVTASGSVFYDESKVDSEPSTDSVEKQVTFAFEQPIYSGGRIWNNIDQTEAEVAAAIANQLSITQSVLLDAATVYGDVYRAQAIFELNDNNVRVLARQLEVTTDRFEVGEVTNTDVAQAKSRLARAKADRTRAQGNLQSARGVFEQVVGIRPQKIDTLPVDQLNRPDNMDQAIDLALGNNPDIQRQQSILRASQLGIDIARGSFWPEIVAEASFNRVYDPNFGFGGAFTIDEQDTTRAGVRLTLPLYQSGTRFSDLRRAKSLTAEQEFRLDSLHRTIRAEAIDAFEQLTAARAALNSRKAQVESADIALDGVREEALVGQRTTLDVLDAEQELLNAKVSVVEAERDVLVTNFRLYQLIGSLHPKSDRYTNLLANQDNPLEASDKFEQN